MGTTHPTGCIRPETLPFMVARPTLPLIGIKGRKMLGGLKEVFEAAEERIKSPILGSIVIAFILMNWKAVYFVVFSGDIALMKFNYFDANTTAKSLLLPIPIGFAAALVVPWVSFIGSFLVELPNRKMKLLQDESTHKILQEKNKLATVRENKKTIYENSLIAEAKRDQEIQSIEDNKIRGELEAKVAESRSIEEEQGSQNLNPNELTNYIRNMSQEEIGLIRHLARIDAGKFVITNKPNSNEMVSITFLDSKSEIISVDSRHRLLLKYEEAVKNLLKHEFIAPTGNPFELEITSMGYDLADRIELDANIPF